MIAVPALLHPLKLMPASVPAHTSTSGMGSRLVQLISPVGRETFLGHAVAAKDIVELLVPLAHCEVSDDCSRTIVALKIKLP